MQQIFLKKIFKNLKGLDRFLILIVLFGAGVAIISLFRGILIDRQVKVEYLDNGKSGSLSTVSKVVVDIEGSVILPGVYELPEGSRLKDVLVMAGGLSKNADREFCEKNLNMAELIKDGQKIYIPSSVDTNTQHGYIKANFAGKSVNINTATIAELDTLWGIGSARAESIVKNRPYQSVDDLVTRGVLTKSLLDKNRLVLSVY